LSNREERLAVGLDDEGDPLRPAASAMRGWDISPTIRDDDYHRAYTTDHVRSSVAPADGIKHNIDVASDGILESRRLRRRSYRAFGPEDCEDYGALEAPMRFR
jgi:hypothetical protein